MLLFLLIFAANLAYSCTPTSPVNTPITTTIAPGSTTIGPSTTTISTTTGSTTPPAPGCCPALTQTLTPSEFPDGIMTFQYNSPTCFTAVVVNCSQSDPAFNLNAAIVANGQAFLDFGPGSITFPGTCNTATQTWEMGTPPLTVQTLECLLTNPVMRA